MQNIPKYSLIKVNVAVWPAASLQREFNTGVSL